MALDQTQNFVRGSVAASIGSSDTTISVSDASVYPDPSNGEYNLTLWDASSYARPDADPDAEIVRVTGRDTTNDDLTVTRGQENTSAVSHPSGSKLLLDATAKTFSDIDKERSSEVVSISADGSTTLFTLPHTHGVAPKTVSVTPESSIAAADHFWVDGKRDTELDIKYASAPPQGSADWNVSLHGGFETTTPDSAINQYIVSSGSGTTVTDSVGSAELSLNGTSKVSDSQAQDGYKLDFNGSSDDATATIDISSLSELLICFTVETTSTEDSRYFGFDENSSNGLIETGQQNDNLLALIVGDGSDLSKTKSNTTITDGSKYRVQAGIVENDKLSVGINGTEETTTSFGTKGDVGDTFVGGRQTTASSRYANISADNILLYDTVSSSVRQDDYDLQRWS